MLFKYGPSLLPKDDAKQPAPSPEVVKPSPVEIPVADAEDLLHHLETAEARTQRAAEGLARSEQWLARVRPSLDQNYLTVEKWRLDTASAILEWARRSAAQAREELEITRNLLREWSEPKA